jgi:hypothetical protein
MAIMIDTRDMSWRDNENGNIHRIVDFSNDAETHIVWFMNVDTLEEHCMNIDLFVEKYTAYGLFDDVEQV